MNQTTQASAPARSGSRLSREAIIAAAFRAWGRTHFTNTSINLVARELEVTKPAVYRYFRSKGELQTALRLDYAARLEEELVAPLVEREPELDSAAASVETLEEAVRAYVTGVFAFFDRNPFHYAFFVRYLLGRPFESRPEFRETIARHDELLLRHLSSPVIMRYVAGTAAYWTTEHYRRDLCTGKALAGPLFEPDRSPPDKNRRTQTIETIVKRLVHGFLPTNHHPVDRELVERTAWFMPEEMPPPDRVFSAVEQVVQEHGYADATVEKIAEQVGITKSSLYHYFRNRDDMLMQVVLRDQRHFASLARVRMQQIEHPEQQLYAFFVMIAGYASQHSAFMTVENWLRENDVNVELPEDHIREIQTIFSFLSEMVMTGKLAADPGEAFSVIGFIRFLILQELNLMEKPRSRERCIGITRTLFALFSGGIAGTVASTMAATTTTTTTQEKDTKR